MTALPIRIEPTARIGDLPLTLVPVGQSIKLDGDCFVIEHPADGYAFTVATSIPPPAQRAPIRLQTCAPRIGATPEEISTNPVELWRAPLRRRRTGGGG